jgi:hypothetical protein
MASARGRASRSRWTNNSNVRPPRLVLSADLQFPGSRRALRCAREPEATSGPGVCSDGAGSTFSECETGILTALQVSGPTSYAARGRNHLLRSRQPGCTAAEVVLESVRGGKPLAALFASGGWRSGARRKSPVNSSKVAGVPGTKPGEPIYRQTSKSLGILGSRRRSVFINAC